nr:site-specific integrase [Oscillospiraceae bacterium]
CRKCHKEVPDAPYCCLCGTKQETARQTHKRGNGQGCVYKTASGKWKLEVTTGYYKDEDGKRHRKYRSKVFDTKKEALLGIEQLASSPRSAQERITFKELFDRWFAGHQAGQSTLNNYKCAIKHYKDIWHLKVWDIEVDDLQECIDSCSAGRRTRENMRSIVSSMYKYGIPRHLIKENLNLSTFLSVSGESSAHRPSFTDTQIEKIKQAISAVPYADYIYCMVYTGFRPSEFLALTADSYDADRQTLTGGAKTEAGKGRVVTISPKIRSIVESYASPDRPYIFGDAEGNQFVLQAFTDKYFYPALERAGIDNPMVEIAGGVKRHQYTPHSCRHTFSTLMKRVSGSDKDKLELMGHASSEMLRYYQDVSVSDLRKITDAL